MLELNKIHLGDCLELMKDIPDKSVDLVVIDPPYNIGKDKRWDKWKTVNQYVEWLGGAFKEIERVLKDNGSFYFFHNDFTQIVELQNWINQNTRFVFNSFIVWDKGDFRALSWKNPGEKSNLRSWFSTAEYIMYYTFQDETGLTTVTLDTNNFSTLRRYFKECQEYTGVCKKIIIDTVGQKADHCFRWASSQWDLPTPETYAQLINAFNLRAWHNFKEYEDLRKEYEDLRKEYEDLRYVHNLDENHNNIWRRNTENTGKYHPTQKPSNIIERIITTSSKPG